MNRLALIALSVSLTVPGAARAQQQEPVRPKLGVGVAVIPFGFPELPAEILVPIQVAPALRIEPSLGIITSDDGDVATKRILLGVGVLAQKRIGTATDMYFGGRLKLGFSSVDVDGGGSDSGNDIVLAGAFGGEHWLAEKFSVGLEAQLGYYSFFQGGGDLSGLYTSGLVLARLYF
jgi:hypothetical protein